MSVNDSSHIDMVADSVGSDMCHYSWVVRVVRKSTLQIARTSAGKSSDDIRRGIGWTPRLTLKTRMQAEMTLLQLIASWRFCRFQWLMWWPKRRLVAKEQRARMVALAEHR